MINNFKLLLLFFVTAAWSQLELQTIGNEYFSNDVIISQTTLTDEFLQVPNFRKDYLLDLASENLLQLYFTSGFFDTKVTHQRKFIDDTQFVTFTIQEGKQYLFGDVKAQVPTWSNTLYNRQDIEIDYDEKFSSKLVIEQLEKARKTFAEDGYLNVEISQKLNIDTLQKRVHISFDIAPNRQVVQGKVHVKIARTKSYIGPAGMRGKTSNNTIRELWKIQNGKTIPASAIKALRKKLLSTGIFSRVSIQDSVIDSTSVYTDLFIEVHERVPGVLGAGLFYEDLIGSGIKVQSRYKNLLGEFHQVGSEATLAWNRQQIAIGYSHPLAYGTDLRIENRIIGNKEQLPIPEQRDSIESKSELINRGRFSYPINSFIQFSGLTDLRYIKTQTAKVKFKFEPSLGFEWVDNRVEPRKGIKVIYSVGQGGDFTWNNRYWYHQVKNRFYIPTGSYSSWAIAADYGRFFNTALIEDARTYYQGGFRSVRGYETRSLFPHRLDSLGSIEGGTAPEYLRVSNEFRFDLPKNWLSNLQLVQFTDWVKIVDQDPTFNKSNRMAIGAGFRYRLSLLTLRLDYTLKKRFKNPFTSEPFEWANFSFDLSQAI